MSDNKEFNVWDFILVFLKWKKLLIIQLILVAALSYLAIYYLIEEEFDSTAVVIPSSDSQNAGLAAMMKSLKDLPFGMGGNTKTAEMDMFTTLVHSRTNLEKIVKKFDLMKDYHLNSLEKAEMQLDENIKTKVTDENAYRITVRAKSPQKAADMVNYILDILNETVININVSKSRDNRVFLEQRYNEISEGLRHAEDSLQLFQEQSGLFEATEQTKSILNAYIGMETEVTAKKMELSVMENINGKDSPKLDVLKAQVNEYEKKLNQMKTNGAQNSILLAVNSLPRKAKNFLRHKRDVEVYSAILEFLVPLYEQAKFEERKSIPVLQVIDHGVPPEKKSYPPRTLLTLIISLGSLFLTMVILLFYENKRSKPKEESNRLEDILNRS
jgi:capsule polysaccharide export protein KpsE/RkpR